MTPHVAIAGGGLGGLTSAKYLADAGVRLTVLEGERFLGGRAATWRDADGEWVEQGLHIFLGVYSEFKKFLHQVGAPPSEDAEVSGAASPAALDSSVAGRPVAPADAADADPEPVPGGRLDEAGFLRQPGGCGVARRAPRRCCAS